MKLSLLLLPVIILFILSYGALKKVKLYSCFVDGARDGIMMVFRIAPFLLTMLFAIDMFRRSGAMGWLINNLEPVSRLLHMPQGVLPLIIVKPLSGSGALGVMTDIMKAYGADSMEGRIAAVMMGSTETIFYTLAVYFGACGIKKTRHSVAAALVAHIAGCIAAIWLCNIFFG